MNHWAQKTLQLVKEGDYLDRLQNIYKHEEGERTITKTTLDSIRKAFEEGDAVEVLQQLLNLEKFPYKDSYTAFLRKDRTAIERNPGTVNRIMNVLGKMGVENVIAGISQAKEANTRRGHQFGSWLNSKYKIVDAATFSKTTDEIVLLEGGEQVGLDFCNVKLKLGITKRPDIVAKAGKRYIVGEAKFLSSTGGNQNRAFADGIDLASNRAGNAYKIFCLDGVFWIEEGSAQYNEIDNSNATILSALLLDEYLNAILHEC